MDALKLLWLNERLSSTDAIMLAFSEQTQSVHLRNLIVDTHAWEGHHEALLQQASEHNDNVHPKFALAVYVAFLKRIQAQTAAVGAASNLHCLSRRDTVGRYIVNEVPVSRQHTFGCLHLDCKYVSPVKAEEDPKVSLVHSSRAPYKLDFCAYYHEHQPDERCTSN